MNFFLKFFLEKVEDKYDFLKNKIRCRLEFVNFLDVIFIEVPIDQEDKKYIKATKNKDFNKKKYYKKKIPDILNKKPNKETGKNFYFSCDEFILWKCDYDPVVIINFFLFLSVIFINNNFLGGIRKIK